jgi:hypothetical protein
LGLDNLLGWKANVGSLPRNGKARNFNAIWPREDIKVNNKPRRRFLLTDNCRNFGVKIGGKQNSSSSNTASPAFTEPWREEM